MKYKIISEEGMIPSVFNTYIEAVDYILTIRRLNSLLNKDNKKMTILYSNSTARAI